MVLSVQSTKQRWVTLATTHICVIQLWIKNEEKKSHLNCDKYFKHFYETVSQSLAFVGISFFKKKKKIIEMLFLNKSEFILTILWQEFHDQIL